MKLFRSLLFLSLVGFAALGDDCRLRLIRNHDTIEGGEQTIKARVDELVALHADTLESKMAGRISHEDSMLSILAIESNLYKLFEKDRGKTFKALDFGREQFTQSLTLYHSALELIGALGREAASAIPWLEDEAKVCATSPTSDRYQVRELDRTRPTLTQFLSAPGTRLTRLQETLWKLRGESEENAKYFRDALSRNLRENLSVAEEMKALTLALQAITAITRLGGYVLTEILNDYINKLEEYIDDGEPGTVFLVRGAILNIAQASLTNEVELPQVLLERIEQGLAASIGAFDPTKQNTLESYRKNELSNIIPTFLAAHEKQIHEFHEIGTGALTGWVQALARPAALRNIDEAYLTGLAIGLRAASQASLADWNPELLDSFAAIANGLATEHLILQASESAASSLADQIQANLAALLEFATNLPPEARNPFNKTATLLTTQNKIPASEKIQNLAKKIPPL